MYFNKDAITAWKDDPDTLSKILDALEKINNKLDIIISMETSFQINNYEMSPCQGCNTNPKNGGDGNCNCILGNHIIYS